MNEFHGQTDAVDATSPTILLPPKRNENPVTSPTEISPSQSDGLADEVTAKDALAYNFDTRKIRSSYNPDDHQNSLSVPIYQNTAFDFQYPARADRIVHNEEAANMYTRLINPTVSVFEQRVTDLEGGVAGLAVASGMAAIFYAIVNLTNNGDHVVISPFLYGGTFDSFKNTFPRFGVTSDVARDVTPEAIEEKIKPETRAVFIESIANPLGTIADIEGIAKVAHQHGIPLVVDNTLATPYLIRPIEHGADVVVHSATKGLSGHGNIIAGLVIENGTFDYANGKFPQFSEDKHWLLRDREDNLRTYLDVFPAFPVSARGRMHLLNHIGAALGPFDAYLGLIGLETLSERLGKQQSSAQKIAEYLLNNEFVEYVNYSGLPSNPNYELARKISPNGAGSIFSFGYLGPEKHGLDIIEETKLFSYLGNIGDAKSLIINSPKLTHGELNPQEQELAHIPANLIRLSIGLEDPEDLIADLDQAFTKTYGRKPGVKN